MRVVITKDIEHKYKIKDYAIKVLAKADTTAPLGDVKPHVFQSFDDSTTSESEMIQQAPTPEPVVSTPQNDELVESLLKKADDFSSKYLKAQMQYEQALEDTEAKVQLAKDQGYQDGITAAREQMQQEVDAKQGQIMMQLESSIATLNNQASAFSYALDGVKEELIGAALDIAKESLQKELGENANGIAVGLATALLKDIKEASKVTLKVNPIQVDAIKTALGESDTLSIVADNAIREGGIVLISDIGTIEADIMQRYEKIKRNAVKS